MGGRSCTRALLPLLLLLAACGNDGSPSASSDVTATSRPSMLGSETTTTSPTSSSRPDTTVWTSEHPYTPCSVTGISPSVYDPAAGQYPVKLTGVDVPDRSVSFDVIQLLVGDAANEAYHRDFPEDTLGVPNDVYSVNESPRVRTAPVAPDVVVRLVRLREDGNANLDAGTFEELPAYLAEYQVPEEPWLSGNPFWLTLRDGAVTDICEQYVP